MATDREIDAMRRALALAVTPDVPVGPNPRVGCVLIDGDGRSIGEGHHHGIGTPHAEAAALAGAGPAAAGTTAVVTLEPCAHTGRTGPCVDALIDAGVRRVVYAQKDSSVVAAGGAARLTRAGIEVEGGVLADEAAAVNPWFTRSLQLDRPVVTWKVAESLDGRVAASDGSSRWITGEAARADGHALRAVVDAVMVGTGTVRVDDPHLTARDTAGRVRSDQPTRVVVGTGPIPSDARVLDDSAPTLVLATRDPREVVAALAARGMHHVLLEGGPTLAAAFVTGGLVDQVVAYVAPVILGSGRAAVADLGVMSLGDAPRMELTDAVRLGDDVRITANVPPPRPTDHAAGG